ncbi:MAG: HAMP domain-containing protein [Bacteroidetes bacterium]|nr:MAG: HAMP domain-containing protein [Bacteroidota bacterium]TAG89630.1 MAG: HAMP domain-containing protein [Bacteroidota bacterium]
MTLRIKLYAGIGSLFLMITILSILGITYVLSLSKASEKILSDNYKSLEYLREMAVLLDKKNIPFEKIQAQILKQQKNITEKGEKDLTDILTKNFDFFQKNQKNNAIQQTLRENIYDLMQMNMNGITLKSQEAEKLGQIAIWIITIVGMVCFLLSFLLVAIFPEYIITPIEKTTESIKQIAAKDYSQRLDVKNNDELGKLAHAFNVMAGKLYEYEHSHLSELLSQKKRMEALIDLSSEAIIGLDQNKKILFINPLAEKILQIKEEDNMGKYAQEIALDNTLMQKIIQELMVGKDENSAIETLKINIEGKENHFRKEIIDIVITPTAETHQVLVGHVILLKNITFFKELDLAKTNFIATISHELKTPLASIKMSLQLLENQKVGILNEEQKELTQHIKEDSERLLKITSELLNLAQVETGNIHLRMEAIQPEKIVEYAYLSVENLAKAKNIEINIEQPSFLPQINADIEKTAWVLINFLSNAIKYSLENQKICVDLRIENKMLVFSVRDFGKGIAKDFQDKIFERFFTIPENAQKQSTGLGLSIAKDFIEAQKGEIGVQSKVGEGARFYFKLPLK